jgi:hypothetical protein
MYNRIKGFLEVNKAGEHPAIFIIAVFINYGLQDKHVVKSLLHQIEMLHDKDPKQYWKLIEELKDTEKIDTASSISTSTWQSHFL